jgi:hypothetical protein
MRSGCLALALLGSAVWLAGQTLDQAPTLAETLQHVGAPLDGLTPAQRSTRITSFQTTQLGDDFAIGYWKAVSGNGLESPLNVGLRERGGPWRVAAFAVPLAEAGSITKLQLTATHLFVGAHQSPSAIRTLVVRRDLTRVGSFYGWWVAGIPDGPAIFVRSMRHFAPAHPEELATFDLVTGKESQLYPTDQRSPARLAFMEQTRPALADWGKRDPGFVYGFSPEWFDVSSDGFQYDARTDTLTFTTRFTSRHPPEIAPPIRAELTVTCAAVRSTARTCTESRK